MQETIEVKLDGMVGAEAPQLHPIRFIPGCNTPAEVTRAQRAINVERDLPWLETEEKKDKPLVIVGGGPSLKTRWREIVEYNADILVLNNAYSFLLERGIIPDYFMLLDARQDNVDFLRHLCTHTKHLIAAQCHPDIFDRLKGFDTTLYLTVLPGTLEATAHIDKPKNLIAGTVGTVGIKALCMAYALGYREIHLFGYDSSYEDEEHHAFEQKLNDTATKIEVFLDGKRYITTATMAHQVAEFSIIAGDMVRHYGCDIRIHCNGLLAHMVQASNQRGEIPLEERERAKYEAVWSIPKYREHAPGEYHVERAAKAFPGQFVIDFGCGSGRAAQALKKRGFYVTGIDFAANCRDPDVDFNFIQSCLWDLPLIECDWGLCTDVMEHIPSEKVAEVLEGIQKRCADGVYFNIATRDDCCGSLVGNRLHMTVTTAQAWSDILSKYWPIVLMEEREGEANFIVRTKKESHV